MKVAIVSSATAGGAGIAALRVARSLVAHAGIEVHFIDLGAIGMVAADVSPQRNFSNGRVSNTQFTSDRGTARREWLVQFLAGFDVVNLHWTSFLLSTSEIEALVATGTPVLFTLHDFNHVTGGCHYPAGCTGLLDTCMGCPQVEPLAGALNAVHRLKLRKNAIFRYANVHLAAPSRYVLEMARCAVGLAPERAHLLRNAYAPLTDEELVLPPGTAPGERPLTVLLIADSLVERRKGAPLAAEALQRFRGLQPDEPLLIHVAGNADAGLIRALKATGAKVVAHGRVTDHARLAVIYAQSDVQLSTSHEDNWPNVLVEAAAYGCLSVVGPGHGCEEFARMYPACPIVPAYTATAFAQGLRKLAALSLAERRRRKSEVRDAVRRDHAPEAVAASYRIALGAVAAAGRDVMSPVAEPAVRMLSSNYLGVATRLLLTPQVRMRGGRLVVSLARPATSAGALTLRAVYGERRGDEVVAYGLAKGAVEVPLHHGDAPLRHVFASELTDYGLSALSYRLDPPVTPQ